MSFVMKAAHHCVAFGYLFMDSPLQIGERRQGGGQQLLVPGATRLLTGHRIQLDIFFGDEAVKRGDVALVTRGRASPPFMSGSRSPPA
jgi:hypothetical protein